MVLQATIENLKERPHHERRAVAAMCAGGVMIVLFIAWIFFFVRTMKTTAIQLQEQQQTQTASAASASGVFLDQ